MVIVLAATACGTVDGFTVHFHVDFSRTQDCKVEESSGDSILRHDCDTFLPQGFG